MKSGVLSDHGLGIYSLIYKSADTVYYFPTGSSLETKFSSVERLGEGYKEVIPKEYC